MPQLDIQRRSFAPDLEVGKCLVKSLGQPPTNHLEAGYPPGQRVIADNVIRAGRVGQFPQSQGLLVARGDSVVGLGLLLLRTADA